MTSLSRVDAFDPRQFLLALKFDVPEVVLGLLREPCRSAPPVLDAEPPLDAQRHFRGDRRMPVQDAGQGSPSYPQLPGCRTDRDTERGQHVITQSETGAR